MSIKHVAAVWHTFADGQGWERGRGREIGCVTSGNCRFALEKSSDDVDDDAATACLFLRNIFLKSHGMIMLPRLKEKVQTEREKEGEKRRESERGQECERIAQPEEDEELKRLTFISHDISHTHTHTHI